MNLKSYNQVVTKCKANNIPQGDTAKALKRLSEFDLTQYEFEGMLKEIISNLDFFKSRLWNSAFTLANMINFAVDAKLVEPENWIGTRLRNRTTFEYKKIINKNSDL